MKTKPAKLLMALLLGMSSMALVSTHALADGESEDSEGTSASTTGCTGKVINACGVKFVQTTCTGTVSSTSKDKDGHDESDDEEHDAEHEHDHDHNADSHRDHEDRSQGEHKVGDGKIAICHRMGGEEKSLVVANDGKLHDHNKHALDTVGRCDDFESIKNDDDGKEDKDKDHKISASDIGYSMGITTSQIACLNHYNTDHSTISIQPPNQGPSRGGARTLH